MSLPLLVDENVHYRVCRLLYIPAFQKWNVQDWLCGVPLLYGVWHAYKMTLTVVYRAFYPLLVQLEQTTEPMVGMKVWCVQGAVHEAVCCPPAV